MTDSHFLNDLNDLDLNDRFFTFLQLPSMRSKRLRVYTLHNSKKSSNS